MTFKDFGNYQRERIQKRLKMSDEKGLAYAGTGDRFDNFNRLGVRLSLPREHILLVYLHKHIDAITSTITDKNDGGESIHSRIDDAITYLELLDGMMYEDNAEVPSERTWS